MKKTLQILFFIIPFLCLSQSENESIISEKLGDFFEVLNHPKSLIDFTFKIPQGFDEYRDGRDNSVVKVFRKIDYNENIDLSGKKLNSSKVEFTVTVLKWKDFPKYKMMLSMSDSEIKELIIKNMKGRDKSIDPNEFSVFYEKNGLFWTISGTWSKEKNIYFIGSLLYTNKQGINLTFHTNTKGDVNKDIKNIKKIIDTFKLL